MIEPIKHRGHWRMSCSAAAAAQSNAGLQRSAESGIKRTVTVWRALPLSGTWLGICSSQRAFFLPRAKTPQLKEKSINSAALLHLHFSDWPVNRRKLTEILIAQTGAWLRIGVYPALRFLSHRLPL